MSLQSFFRGYVQMLLNDLFEVDDHPLAEPFQILAGDQLMRMDPRRGYRRLLLLPRSFHITSFSFTHIPNGKPKPMGSLSP